MSETPETDQFAMFLHGQRLAPDLKYVTASFSEHLEKDRNRWRSVAEQVLAVAIVQLYDSHKQDCIDAFSLDQLHWASYTSAPLRPKSVEAIYLEALSEFDSLRKEATDAE